MTELVSVGARDKGAVAVAWWTVEAKTELVLAE